MKENMRKLITITLLLLPLSALAQKTTIIDDSQLHALTTIGGANVLPTTRTVPHWWGSTLDPHNGSRTATTWSAQTRTTAQARAAR
jgi:hypothetical protein